MNYFKVDLVKMNVTKLLHTIKLFPILNLKSKNDEININHRKFQVYQRNQCLLFLTQQHLTLD